MKLGLALSGGGIRGIAHAGVLKALEENDIKVDVIGGTSAGGLIASLYAIGYSPMYIYLLFKKYANEIININTAPIISGISNFMNSKKNKFIGLKSGESIEKAYNNLALKKKIIQNFRYKNATCYTNGGFKWSKEYIFTNYTPQSAKSNSSNSIAYITDISVGKAVRASSVFQQFFAHVSIKIINF